MWFLPWVGHNQTTATKSSVFYIKVTTLDDSRPWPAHPSGLATSVKKAHPSGLVTSVQQNTLIKFYIQTA